MPTPPLDDFEAAAIVERMKQETSRKSRVHFWRVALRIGNLTEGARLVYQAAIDEECGE